MSNTAYPHLAPTISRVITAQLSIASKRFHSRFAFILESVFLLQFEQLLVKENSNSATKFQKSYFSEETDPEFNENFEPSKAMTDMKDYMSIFINKLKQTMI